MADHDLVSGLIRLHVLYHATHEPVFGQGLMDELARHGYRVSAGTLYPILHGMEKSGYLRSRARKVDAHTRRTYVATAAGRRALRAAKSKVWELFREFFEEELEFRLAEQPRAEANPVAHRRPRQR